MTTKVQNKIIQNLVASLVGIIITLALIAVIELTCGHLNKLRAQKKQEDWIISPGFRNLDPTLGYVPGKNKKYGVWFKHGGETVYKVVYDMDEFGRRRNVVPNNPFQNKHLIFFGGSTVLGEGVHAHESLPTYTGLLASGHRVYNYGFGGYGPQQMLAKLKTGDLPNEVKEKNGLAVYVFIDGHVDRAIGAMQIYNLWGMTMPYFTIEDGKLVRRGNFTTGRPNLSKLYHFLGKSQIIKFFRMNLPFNLYSDKNLELTARIIEEASKDYKNQFNNNEFYVLFFPGSKHGSKITSILESKGVRCLDYSNLIDMEAEGNRIKHDRHPTPKVHRSVATKLALDLGIFQKRPK